VRVHAASQEDGFERGISCGGGLCAVSGWVEPKVVGLNPRRVGEGSLGGRSPKTTPAVVKQKNTLEMTWKSRLAGETLSVVGMAGWSD
jgi:hypothetical protein